jgi:hypothetical protein
LSTALGLDKWTWVPFFSSAYFHHEKDSDVQRSKHQAHTMDSIVFGRSSTSNALLVYNPHNKQYYKPVIGHAIWSNILVIIAKRHDWLNASC